MRGMKKLAPATSLLILALLAMPLWGCKTYRNPHGLQDHPTIIRIVTIPEGAELKLVKYNLLFTTPADIELEVLPEDEVLITKDGYHTFRGSLADIPQIALDTYRVKLQPDR